MTDELKQFLSTNKELFKINNFKEILRLASSANIRAELLDFLFNTVHINPLNYMDEVPGDFFYRTVIPTIEIPSNIKVIKQNGIRRCETSTILIKSSDTKLEEGAIKELDSLNTINFPEGTTVIPKATCVNCRNLSRVNLPVSVKRIKTGCFENAADNLRIVTPYRENKADKLTIPSDEVEFYRAHLRFTHAPKEVNNEV